MTVENKQSLIIPPALSFPVYLIKLEIRKIQPKAQKKKNTSSVVFSSTLPAVTQLDLNSFSFPHPSLHPPHPPPHPPLPNPSAAIYILFCDFVQYLLSLCKFLRLT